MSKFPNKLQEKKKRAQKGLVVGDSMDRTIVVEVSTLKTHPKYRKKIRTTKKYHVHDESNAHKVGDTVFFEQCRPFSKTKKWVVVQVEENEK